MTTADALQDAYEALWNAQESNPDHPLVANAIDLARDAISLAISLTRKAEATR